MSRAMVPVVLSMVFLMLSVFTVKKSVLPWRSREQGGQVLFPP